MPFVHQILLALRTIAEEEPPSPSRRRRRHPNDGSKSSNRGRQTAAIVLTFRDLFRSGGLNFILDEMDMSRPRRSSSRNSFATSSNADRCLSVNAFDLRNHKTPVPMSSGPDLQDETTPLLIDDMSTISSCKDLVVVSPAPVVPRSLFSKLSFIRKKEKPVNMAVPLSSDNETKTVETLRKVLKWSPKKQNSATFAVPLPRKEEHEVIAVVQNAVNQVKEEQQKKKKKKKFWLKICKI